MVTHGSVVSVEVSSAATAAAFARRETRWSSVPILVLGLGLLDIDASAIDLCHGVVLDEALSDLLVSECDEAETS